MTVPVDGRLRRLRPGIETRRRFSLHRFVHDGVAAVDRLGLVADDRHRHGARHTGPFERPHRRPPHVVNQLARTPGRLAGVLPRRAERHDPFAVPVEDERADRAGRLQPLVLGELAFEDRFDLGRERERPSLAVLRRVRVQPNTAPGPIDVDAIRAAALRSPCASPWRRRTSRRDAAASGRASQMAAIWSASRNPRRVLRSCNIGTCGHCTRRPACTANRNARRERYRGS